MKSMLKSKYTSWIIVALIIIINLVRLCYSYYNLKEGFHVDEVWSFGLANSYYEPFIFQSDDHNEKTNLDQWLSSQTMRNYLTVDETQRFSYDSVYYNQVHDYHPPLYYYILHTICSMFPGSFSPWYGYIINIGCFIFTVIFYYLLLLEITKSSKLSLLGCVFYSFSLGAFNTFIYIRMYALLTMLTVFSLYCHAELYYKKNLKKCMLPLFVVTVLGALTHHFYIPFAGIISMCFCIYYLVKKNFRYLFSYAVLMLSAVGVSLILFPATIDHVLGDRTADPKFIFSWQFKMTVNCVLRRIFGVVVPVVGGFDYIVAVIVVSCIAFIVSPLIYLFRKEKWMKKIKVSVKNTFYKVKSKEWLENRDLMIISMVVASVGMILLTSLTVSMLLMKHWAERFVFNIYPCVCAIWTIGCYRSLTIILKTKTNRISFGITAFLCGLFCVMTNLYKCEYFFTKPNDVVSINSLPNGSDYVLVVEKNSILTLLCSNFLDSSYIFVTESNNLSNKLSSIPDTPDKNDFLFWIVEKDSLLEKSENTIFESSLPTTRKKDDTSQDISKDEFESLLRAKYSQFEYIGYDREFGRDYYIYKVD